MRKYATEAPKSGGGSNLPILIAGGVGVAGAGYYFLSGTPTAKKIESKVVPASQAKKAFTGGDQGFVSLKLSEVENVNHNTKRFRFELPEEDMVSGLSVASAILTKYKGPQDEKATLRPYTPISYASEKGYMDLLV